MAILAIDLDGTLAEWESARAEDPAANRVVGQWVEGAQDALWKLREAGHVVVVHTCRATWTAGGGLKAVATFLRSGGFVPFAVEYQDGDRDHFVEEWRWIMPDGDIDVSVCEPNPSLGDVRNVGIWFGRGKPVAHHYIDDRALRFLSWPSMLLVVG